MTLTEVDLQLEALLEAGIPPDAPAWQALLEKRADVLASLPACPQTLQALEISLLSGARLMSALRAERQRALAELDDVRQIKSVHAGYAGEDAGALREWSA